LLRADQPAASGVAAGTPLWIGRNSHRSRRRVARYGDGWTPLLVSDTVASTIGTPAMSSLKALPESLDDLKALVTAEGRDPSSIDIQVEWADAGHIAPSHARSVELVHSISEAGVTWMVLNPPADGVERAVDGVLAYGEAVGALVTH
jgi:alkanesulfonate monooxygenase SsuD/methylene tetrahydromethanopterin reductase-like flavin-dependent oxidoreductase (luciferase family)